MIADVNCLVYAFRPDFPLHKQAVAAVDSARHSNPTLTVLPEVAVGFLRVVTNPRALPLAEEPQDAMAFLDAVTNGGRTVREAPRGRWHRFQSMASRFHLRGNDLHDGLLASACIEADAAILTADKGFLKYPGLRVNLLTPIGVVEHVNWS